MRHFHSHKKWLIVLGPKTEGPPDGHRTRSERLFELARLLSSAGNHVKRTRLLTQASKLQRERGDDRVARTLSHLSDANRGIGLHEGAERVKEGLEIYERLGDTAGQAECLKDLAWVLYADGQLDAAEGAASRADNLLQEEGGQLLACRCHRIPGDICYFKGRREDAINNFEAALSISSSFDWHDQLPLHVREAWGYRFGGKL